MSDKWKIERELESKDFVTEREHIVKVRNGKIVDKKIELVVSFSVSTSLSKYKHYEEVDHNLNYISGILGHIKYTDHQVDTGFDEEGYIWYRSTFDITDLTKEWLQM